MKNFISIALIIFGIYLTGYSITRIQTPQQLASLDTIAEYAEQRAKPGEALSLLSIGLGFFTIGYLTVKTSK